MFSSYFRSLHPMDSHRFWDNYRLFAGGEGQVFLDNIPFRKYLNKYFKVGRASLAECVDTHWIFIPDDGPIYDSIEEGHQPPLDFHCTMFSFYHELLASSYQESLGLKGLVVATTHKKYISNLIEVYSALANAFRDKDLVNYIHKYRPWKNCKNYLTDGDYSGRAEENIEMLKYLKREAGRGPPIDLFA